MYHGLEVVSVSGITIATLVHMARENGWRPSAPINKPAPDITAAPKPIKKDTAAYGIALFSLSDKSDSFVAGHAYAESKGITWAAGAGRGIASGSVIGRDADSIFAPVYNLETGELQGCQAIVSSQKKQTFGPVKRGGLILGNSLDKSLTWYIAEGWSTAVSVVFHHQNGNGVCVCAYGKTNLDNAAKIIARVHQPDEIVILRENDD